jgi:hypothetical protein
MHAAREKRKYRTVAYPVTGLPDAILNLPGASSAKEDEQSREPSAAFQTQPTAYVCDDSLHIGMCLRAPASDHTVSSAPGPSASAAF